MRDQLRRHYHSIRNRILRIERREVHEIRRWLEDTENLLHFSVVVIVPLLIGAITWIANVSPVVSFLVYPPLASGTYTLFADPDGPYSSPTKFVGGMTAGALSGWFALEIGTRFWYQTPAEQFQVQAGVAAFGIFLTGIVTWVLSLEEPTAFSTALLVLVTGSDRLAYVTGIIGASLLIAGAFVLWRRHFYHERARYLYTSTHGDDQILVPVRGETSESLALFAARLAAAHDASKVVLLRTVSEEVIEETETIVAATQRGTVPEAPEEPPDEGVTRAAEELVTEQQLQRLEGLKNLVESTVDVSCEFVIAAEGNSAGETVLTTAEEENCDLIVCPYDTEDGGPSPFVRTILKGNTDSIVLRSSNGRTEWRRILVMARSSGEPANAMLDFAVRLLPPDGTISACTCISHQQERRTAEIMLENLVEQFSTGIETRISVASAEAFLDRNASSYDLAVVGASTDRSVLSRVVSMPTFERIQEVDCDVAIVHRA
ncbi:MULTISPECIES: HPP family protein [Halorubrum]|uniref:Universal stress protein family protein n=1 Tax=Halorubrum sodomense TaxID=35743 RepID=A0A1I6HR18_HALSD|nr:MULTISPECIES: HPP family protein [Halorubrum]TKX55585.1 HPP family protein [Halorubrum sp. SP3]SFR56710.1 Universal stress protein family protein [Halorubrum sodomense]